ncbi:hypothetical protein cand_013980 [Cryptosporidium andersoni]|uniref:Uncharacterized protein n=1 Tax=Cryptosporidium andersoni TaxID=117008 RepID=A0A1J4MUL3_9CRYT|nr:hypothetical protein cand_013980 [Cryptosporidium andersoni]
MHRSESNSSYLNNQYRRATSCSASVSELGWRYTPTWSSIFSPFKASLRESYIPKRKESSYGIPRSRSAGNISSNFRTKGSLRPSFLCSKNNDEQDSNSNTSRSIRMSSRIYNNNNPNSDDLLFLDDTFGIAFRPLFEVIKINEPYHSRVSAFSYTPSNRKKLYRYQYEKLYEPNNLNNNDVNIIRFHDGISGKSFKLPNIRNIYIDRNKQNYLNNQDKLTYSDYIEVDWKKCSKYFDKNEFTISRDRYDKSLNTSIIGSRNQGDIPYCDAIIYLNNPKPNLYNKIDFDSFN